MLKKIFISFILLSAVLSQAAYAEISEAFVSETGEVRLNGKSSEPEGTNLSVLIVKPKKSHLTAVSDDADGEKASDVLESIGQIKVGKDFSYEYTYKLHEDAVSGEYYVVVKAYGTEKQEKASFVYSNYKRKAEAYEKIAAGEDIRKILDEYANDIDYSAADTYYNFNDKQKAFIADGIKKSNVNSTQTLYNEFTGYLKLTTICSDLKSCEKTDVRDAIENSWKKIGIDEADYLDYCTFSASKKEWAIVNVIENSKSAMSAQDVAALFKESVKSAKSKSESGNKNTGSGSGGSVSISSGFMPGTSVQVTVEPEKIPGEFDDIANVPWAENAINTLVKYSVINGKGNRMFCPNDYVKREEFVQMIVKSFNISSSGNNMNFDDVLKDEWYYEAVKAAYENGIAKGISENKFGVGSYITRQDMAVMLYRAAEYAGVEILPVDSQNQVMDIESVSEYALQSVKELVKAKVINGDENQIFNPKNNATRAQAAVMIFNILYK